MGVTDERRKAQSERIADSIKEQERRREEIKFREAWNKRIDIARDGRIAYEGGDPVTAVMNYKRILTLTARRLNVTIDQLHPKLFDKDSRITECLLLSAITFDLAKIVERLHGESALRDLNLYLRLFVLFSKNMPFEVVATNTIRKYIEFSHGLRHKKAFEGAYDQMKRKACFVATVAFQSPVAPEVLRLQVFRDEVLSKNLSGRIFIFAYYQIGSALAKIIGIVPGMGAITRLLIRILLKWIP